MTGKIKRRSLRCGGRPKADFGSLFTSVIAPALNVAGSIADESIDNNKTATNGVVNNNTTIPSDPTKTPTMRLGGRKKCWIGAAIGAATSIAGSLFGNGAQKREMRRQKSIQDWQNATQEAANMTSVLNNSRDYQEDYLRQFRTAARLGKTLGAKGIYITDGGDATKIGNNTYLLRGGSHEDVNETGQTGIGINVGGNEVEAEGGEVAQKKNGALRIFSAQPILGNGMSPAQAILRGYNKDAVFSQQQAFKKRNGLKDDGSAKYEFGGVIDALNDWVRTNRHDNVLADFLYESDLQAAQRIAYAAKEAKDFYRGLGINIPVGRNQIYNPTFRSSEIASKIKDANDALQIYLNNTHLPKGIRLTPVNQGSISRTAARIINPREAEIVKMGIPISQSAKTMTNGANPFLYTPRSSNEILEGLNRVISSAKQGVKNAGQKVGNKLTSSSTYRTPTFAERVRDANGELIWKQNYKYKPWVKATAGAAGTAGVIGLGIGLSNTNSKVKKERLNRIVGARRVAKALGGYSRPVEGMRPKALGGMYIPFNKRYTSIYDAPDYDSNYNGGNVLGNGEVTITAKRIKPTFMKPNNDAMNLIKVPKEEVPYIPQKYNRSRTIFSGGDYLGLGIDTLAALSTGLVNYNTAGKYTLPDRAPIIQASKLPTTYNVNPEIEEVKRYRDRLTGQTFNNTSSSVAALNRSGAINLDALSNLSKLWATKENEENKMLTEDAKNQQTVAAQNIQNELARQSEIARIKNEAIQAKGNALNVGLSGLSQAWTNFWTAGRTAYEDDQARRAMVASSKDATPTRLIEMGYDLSPDLVASLYGTAKDDRTKRFYLSRLSSAQRQKYGIN